MGCKILKSCLQMYSSPSESINPWINNVFFDSLICAEHEDKCCRDDNGPKREEFPTLSTMESLSLEKIKEWDLWWFNQCLHSTHPLSSLQRTPIGWKGGAGKAAEVVLILQTIYRKVIWGRTLDFLVSGGTRNIARLESRLDIWPLLGVILSSIALFLLLPVNSLFSTQPTQHFKKVNQIVSFFSL